MENKSQGIEDLFQKLKEYGEVRFNLLRLKGINKLAGVLSSFLSIFVLIIIFGAILLCITIGLAILIGSWIGKMYYGFFIVAAIYLIIGLVLYFMRDKLIKSKISNKLIKELLD